jgi:hypothetical protein
MGKLIFNPAGSGETITVNTTRKNSNLWVGKLYYTNLTGNDKIYSTDAMACRAVTIQNIKIQPVEEQPQPANVGVEAELG